MNFDQIHVKNTKNKKKNKVIIGSSFAGHSNQLLYKYTHTSQEMEVLSTNAPHIKCSTVVAVFKNRIKIYIQNMHHIYTWICALF